mgnify:CR=1 FL=1
MKTCKMCGEARDESNFPGRKRTCNICYNRMYHENVGGLRDRVLARTKRKDAKRTKLDHLEKKRKAMEKWPEKMRARQIVANALKKGTVTRMPCQICGSDRRVHAHHDDYSKPLQILWLCSFHHGERHRLLNRYGSPGAWPDFLREKSLVEGGA